MPGLYAGYMYPAWLIAFLAFLGLAWGLAERWMLARVTPARLVLLAGAVQAAVSYEGGLPALADTMRSAAVIAVMAWGAGALVKPRVPGRRQTSGCCGSQAIAFSRFTLPDTKLRISAICSGCSRLYLRVLIPPDFRPHRILD